MYHLPPIALAIDIVWDNIFSLVGLATLLLVTENARIGNINNTVFVHLSTMRAQEFKNRIDFLHLYN